MGSKQKYHDFCKTESSIPIFSKDWWLDAVCGKDNWDVVLVEKGGQIIASMPYYMVKRRMMRIMRIITMPQLTQTMGPWLRPSNAKYANQLAEQKNLTTALIQKLPHFDYFCQNFHYSITNWLPFYWQGFSQTTRYTYVLEEISDTQKIWNGMLPKIRTDIKKAQNRFGLQVCTDLGIDTFLTMNEQTFARQGMKLPYSKDFVKRLDYACEEHNARRIFFAKDMDDRIHAAAYIVWDENSAYYLMGGSDSDLRNSGANSLCMWKAIEFASTVTKAFDFEGSMIEPVERFFRAFGVRQIPYFQVSKINLPFFKIYQDIRSWGGMLRKLIRNRTRTKSSAKDS
jgi:lipid II:glycine glycyltransferase (peptidoglycan interpeptide bridge formation enzyme)